MTRRRGMLAGAVPEWARRRDDLAVSLNLERRDLDESQRAMVAARLATLRKGGDAGKPAGGNVQIAHWYPNPKRPTA